MTTFITAITNIIRNTCTHVFYPGYIEDQKKLGDFESSLSELERGVTIHRIYSNERMFKPNGQGSPSTLKELFFGWLTK